MFSILCMHSFIAYQARITQRNSGAIDEEDDEVFWLLDQVSLDIIWRTSLHIYKTIHSSYNFTAHY